MRHLLFLAIVLLLSACGPDEDIPGVDVNQSESVPAAAAQGAQP